MRGPLVTLHAGMPAGPPGSPYPEHAGSGWVAPLVRPGTGAQRRQVMALARRAWMIAAALVTPVVAAVPAAHADAVFQVQTIAAAVHVNVTQQPASSIITASLFDDAVAYAASEFDSGGSSEALAASAFP